MAVLAHPVEEVFPKMVVFYESTSMGAPTSAFCGDTVSVHPDIMICQMGAEDSIDESLFGLSFNHKMEACAHTGRPPRTFFSQSSESE